MLLAYHRGNLAETLKERRPERPGGLPAVDAPPDKTRSMIENFGSAQSGHRMRERAIAYDYFRRCGRNL